MGIKKFTYTIAAVIVAVLFIFLSFVGGGLGVAHAATSTTPAFEQSNILDDLNGSTIAGKEFSVSDHPFDDKGKPQIISFIEYCYSYKSEKQSDYGLYVYVYNPQGLKFDTSTERNKIQFAYGGKDNWTKYVLEFLNYSTQSGYEGLFYKFKIALSGNQRLDILNTVNQSSRVYEISAIELSVNNTVTDYAQVLTYTYSGYAKGCGSDLSTDDTLTCTVDGLKETLSLNVHSTYWRPAGTHSDGYTKDTLHSVYFSVPNETIKEYGEMTAVHATWLNAYTAPIFVTGNSSIYNALLPHVAKFMDGGTVKNYTSDSEYALIATKAAEGFRDSPDAAIAGYYAYNAYTDYNSVADYDKYVKYLNYLFLAENGNADNYVLSAEKLLGWFKTFTEKFGGIAQPDYSFGNTQPDNGGIIDAGVFPEVKRGLINDRYSAVLFDSVDKKFTDVTIEATTEYKLTDNTVSDNIWTRLFGGSLKKEHSYNMSAIQKVTGSDISFYSGKTAFCNNFYVAESDYSDFCDYVKTADNEDETVYLFRYYQSEYVSNEVTEYERTTNWNIVNGNYGGYKSVDTNAYFAQEWVQLDFDIIDLTFTKNGVKTVIPVVMSPIDIVAGVEPPVSTQPEKPNYTKLLKLIIGIIAAILVLVLCAPIIVPILNLIIQAVLCVIALPFRLLGKLFKRKR